MKGSYVNSTVRKKKDLVKGKRKITRKYKDRKLLGEDFILEHL